MPSCSVKCCKNNNRNSKGRDIQFFSFSKQTDLCNRWIEATHQDKINLKNARICSIHFTKDSFIESHDIKKRYGYPISHNRVLKPDAVPTKYLLSRTESLPTISKVRNISITAVKNAKPLISSGSPSCKSSTAMTKKTLLCRPVSPSCSRKDNEDLNEKIRKLEEKIVIIQRENTILRNKNNTLNLILNKYFTTGQVKMLKSGKKNIHWTADDICSAISLRSVSPKAYRYLKNVKQYPLPALSTLRRWASARSLDSGILKEVLSVMKSKAQELTALERVCVLSFDEMYLSQQICIDKKMEKVLGPYKSMQTVMIRSLFGTWKQIVYYNFDTTMSEDILVTVVSQLYLAGYTVAAIVCDLRPTNLALWTKLDINFCKQTYILHPLTKDFRIYFFADVPHLMKLARNHLLDSGFSIEGLQVNKTCLEKLLQLQASEPNLASKLTRYHLEIAGTQRQKVKPAVQIFSRTLAQAITCCGEKNLMENVEWKLSSHVIKVFNDWFDIFNVKTKSDSNCDAFGLNVEQQMPLLDEMTHIINTMRVGSHKSLLPFQRGILLNNKSLVDFFQYLKTMFPVEYILTYKLNQDILENFFSCIRGMGLRNDHPSPLDFSQRVKWYVTGKHSSSVFSDNRNTEDDASESCLVNISETQTNLTSEV